MLCALAATGGCFATLTACDDNDDSVSVTTGQTLLSDYNFGSAGGNMTVDESIKAYMEGMSTAVKCKPMLDEMSQKVTIAREKARKAMEDAPAQDGQDPEEEQW